MSSDSFVSLFIPSKKVASAKNVPVPATETGRVLHFSTFLMCFDAVLLLTSGIIFITVSLWIIIMRYQYNKLMQFPIFDLGDIGIFGGLLGIPCFWIAYATHENKKNNVFLPFLIVLLIFSLIVLTIGITVATLNRTRICFECPSEVENNINNTNNYPKLIMEPYSKKLRHNMLITMESYFDKGNSYYKRAWNDAQNELKCCGVTGPSDWEKYNQSIPRSCYQKNILQVNGCLDLVVYKLACQMNIAIGLTSIMFVIQTFSLSLAYLRNKMASIDI